MSTYTSGPGTCLAGRYRLVDQTSAGTGWAYWKATDEILARPVTVLTFAAGFERAAETITAARAASRLSDPRFAQVFDVEDTDDLAYVVTEWVAGESLLDMLADGPLDSPRAVSLMSEAARALAAAHAAGLAHLRLDPACLHWTRGSGVKITGLGMDAALAGTAPPAEADGDDPELADTRGLARLLYAALTGYWPGPRESSPAPGPAGQEGAAGSGPALLPPAPETDGAPCTPRQVSAAVPANIDALTCQALFQRPSRHGPALSTPAMFADALASAAPPMPLPFSPGAAPVTRVDRAGYGYRRDGSSGPYPPEAVPIPGPHLRPGGGRKPPGRRSSAVRAVIGVVIVLVLAAIGVAAWSVSRSLQHSAAPAPSGTHSPSHTAAAAVPLRPVSAAVYNPLGSSSDDDPSGAPKAIDGDP